MFTVLVVVGAGAALLPGLPVIKLLLRVQVLNAVLLPIILVFILLLIRDKRLVGELRNTRFYTFLGWGTFGMITLAELVMLTSQLFEALGMYLPGG